MRIFTLMYGRLNYKQKCYGMKDLFLCISHILREGYKKFTIELEEK